MSLYPVYEYMVRGSADSSDYDLFDRRSLRASSALPDSTYLRGYSSVRSTFVPRSLSVARDIIEEPEPLLSHSTKLSDLGSVYRYSSGLTTDSPYTSYVSSYGYTIPLYRRKYYPSSYGWERPYSSTLPYYSSRFDDDYYNAGGYTNRERDPFVPYYRGPYSGQSRYPYRDWRTEYPYRSYSPTRPRYIWPTVRSSYLYPKYV